RGGRVSRPDAQGCETRRRARRMTHVRGGRGGDRSRKRGARPLAGADARGAPPRTRAARCEDVAAAVTHATVSGWLQCAISGDTARLGGPMLKKIAFTAVALLAILAIAIATRPADFRVSRSQSIDALASGVYGQVADFHRRQAWAPWEKPDRPLPTG